MRAVIRDSLENLYPDSSVTEPACRRMQLDVPRGGIAAVHVLLNDVEPHETLRLSATENGRRPRGARWFRLVDVPVEENTGLIGFTEGSPKLGAGDNAPNPFVVRRAPFRVYDAMEPVDGEVRTPAPTTAIRLHLPIPPDAKPGTRTISISIRQAGAPCELALMLRVHRATVPPVGRNSLPVTNWFSFENIAQRHGLKMWSEPYWRMLRRYANLMAHGRQNTFWIPLSTVFASTKAGLRLNRERLDRIVGTFSRAGLHYIEGGHVANRTGGEWEAKTFDTVFGAARATSPEGNAVLASICRQLMAEISRNRWAARWIQHVTDEPTPTNAADYRILVGMVRKYMPGIPLLDATQDPTLAGSVDIWCPQVQEYQRDRAAYEAQRKLGDRVWYYTCCFPGGPWLNRLLDQELLRPLLLGWAGALFRLDGFLHWGFNHYRQDQDPFTMSVLPHHGGGTNSLPPGDTHIAYPGTDGPWSSLRLEAHREGFEDYELLRILQDKNPRAASAVLAKAVTGFDQYTRDVASFRAARKALLRALGR